MHLAPRVGVDADAIEAVAQLRGHLGAAGDAVDVEVLAHPDRLGDPRHLLEIDQRSCRLERAGLGVQQRAQHVAGCVLRIELAADVAAPRLVGVVVTEVGSQPDAELHVAGVAEEVAEAGERRRRRTGARAATSVIDSSSSAAGSARISSAILVIAGDSCGRCERTRLIVRTLSEPCDAPSCDVPSSIYGNFYHFRLPSAKDFLVPFCHVSPCIAVDVGGTSTRAVIVEADGRCVGYGTAGRGNPTASGAEPAAAAIVAAITAALDRSGVDPGEVRTAVAAIAGASTRSAERASGRARSGGIRRRRVPRARSPGRLLLGDARARRLRARGGHRCDRRPCPGRESRRRVRRGGVAARRPRIRLLDRAARRTRGLPARSTGAAPPTALVDLLLAELGIDIAMERGLHGRVVALGRVVDAVYQIVPVELARFAPLAFEAAARGDEVAAGIVAGAADELVATISAVVTLGLAGPVVLGGGVLSQQPTLAQRIVEALRAEGIDGPFITVADGTVGAAVLALRHGGVVVDDIVFDRITSSLAALR